MTEYKPRVNIGIDIGNTSFQISFFDSQRAVLTSILFPETFKEEPSFPSRVLFFSKNDYFKDICWFNSARNKL